MLVIPHFILMNPVQISRCGCFIDIRCRKTFFFFFSHESGVFGEMMPSLMCLFPGDRAQRNSEEPYEAE